MSMDGPNNYCHRENYNHSFDAICPRCFRTVSQRATEDELTHDEEKHICGVEDQNSPSIMNGH